MSAAFAFVLFLVSVVAGALNAVAGGGSFITLPMLVHGGVSPVMANATSTTALWPGSVSSAWAYRREVSLIGRLLPWFAATSLAGGLLGALLLVRTSNDSFIRDCRSVGHDDLLLPTMMDSRGWGLGAGRGWKPGARDRALACVFSSRRLS